jgi:transmembrane sensor
MSDRSPFQHLPDRVGATLDDTVEEARVHELWRGTRNRMARRDRRQATLRAAGGVGLVAAIALVALVEWPSATPDSGSLALATGGLPTAVQSFSSQSSSSQSSSSQSSSSQSSSSHGRRIALAEGSSVTLAPGSRWEPLHNTERQFESEVRSGSATFDVVPGGPRRWTVRAGQTRVEVVGTRFIVEHTADVTRVAVEHGVVRVSDPRLDHGEVTLRAGDEVVVGAVRNAAPDPISTAPVSPAPVSPTAALPTEPAPRVVSDSSRASAESASRRASSDAWRELAEQGAHDEAYRVIGRAGLEARARTASAEQLMLLADVARLSGHPNEAIAPLERLIAEHPSDGSAPVAAVVLGRIEMDRLGRSDRARRAFERALELGVPASLRPDVERRLAELVAVDAESTTAAPAARPTDALDSSE